MAVINDIVEGNTGKLTLRGWEFDRIFFVSKLVTDGFNMTIEAIETVGIQLGDSHPSIPTAYVFDITSESITTSGNQMKITYFYRQFEVNLEYDIDPGLENEIVTDFFLDNTDGGVTTEMVLQYTYPTDYKHEPKVAGLEDSQGVSADIFQSKPKFTISRNERFTILADNVSGYPRGIPLKGSILVDRNIQFTNKVNYSGWFLRPNDEAGTWICLGIRAVSIENGLSWRVSYTFAFDFSGWSTKATFKDPTSGDPVPDPTFNPNPILTGSQKNFDQYLLRNFTLLELI